jgi:hypothetical protein
VWHGQAKPCVSCGQLVRREQRECDHCGQDLSDEMIDKMRAHAGPWDVFEHVRPFPGVSLERIIRQIHRGVLTETSIVRGPATDFQWRFAVETAGLCRYFGRCWKCHAEVSPSDTYCPTCLEYLSFEKPRPAQDASVGVGAVTELGDAGQPSTQQLRELTAALDENGIPRHEAARHEPPRIAGIRATWVALAILVVVVAALLWVTKTRGGDTGSPAPTAPAITLPAASPGN